MNIVIDIFKLLVDSLVEIITIIFSLFSKNHGYYGKLGNQRKVLRSSHKKNGLRIGHKYISLKQSLHGGMLLIGKTGSGKSVKVFFQNLFGAGKMQHPTSFICLDPTLELRDKSISYMIEQLDYEEEVINFSDASKSTITWNPIENLPADRVHRFAGELVAVNSTDSPKDPIWNNMSTLVISMMIHLLKTLEIVLGSNRYTNLFNVRHLISLMQSDTEKVNRLFSKFANSSLYNDYKGFLNSEEKFFTNVISSSLSVLVQWKDSHVIRTTSSTTLDMASYRNSKKILFIQNDLMSQKYLQGINSLFLKSWFSHITEAGIPDAKSNILAFMIDEASSLRTSDPMFIPFITSQVRKYLSYGIWGFQSYNQCIDLYTRQGAETLRINTGTVLYLGNQDLETGRTISQSLGKYTYEKDDFERTREVLTTEEAMRLNGCKDGGILLSGNQPPILLKKIQGYYENKSFKKWSEVPTPPIRGIATEEPELLPIDELLKQPINA